MGMLVALAAFWAVGCELNDTRLVLSSINSTSSLPQLDLPRRRDYSNSNWADFARRCRTESDVSFAPVLLLF